MCDLLGIIAARMSIGKPHDLYIATAGLDSSQPRANKDARCSLQNETDCSFRLDTDQRNMLRIGLCSASKAALVAMPRSGMLDLEARRQKELAIPLQMHDDQRLEGLGHALIKGTGKQVVGGIDGF